MNRVPAYTIAPLGDSALIIDFGNSISLPVNEQVIALFNKLKQHPLHGMIEAVPAYSSLAVYYDVAAIRKKITPGAVAFDWVSRELEKLLSDELVTPGHSGSLVSIPVCYEKEFGPDLEWIATQNKIAAEEIIRLHTAGTYRVFMLGFLPGFAYMGEVDEKIATPRKQKPVPVKAGSVGIAGRQTGIYPLSSPGGWQIIGQTPLHLFNKDETSLTLLKPGDNVKFHSINKDEFIFLKPKPGGGA